MTDAPHHGMPQAAIDTGMIDWVLPVVQMPAKLLEYHQLEGRLELPPEQQTALLESIGRKGNGDAPGRKFFLLIRRYTVMGYYTSKVGLEELDFPGLRFYTQSPACPHRDDPEHQHLPPPRF